MPISKAHFPARVYKGASTSMFSMRSKTRHKTVQARILKYAQEIGWAYVLRDEAERRRGFTPHPSPLLQAGRGSVRCGRARRRCSSTI